MDPIVIAVLLVPFVGAVVCGLVPRGIRAVAILTALATAALACVKVVSVFPGADLVPFGILPWLPGALGKAPAFGLLVDSLSSLMLLLVTVVGFMVVLYSADYMSGKNAEHPYREGDSRYYFWLLCFLGSMVGLTLSPNLLQMFIFWELTTICSWALIAHTRTEVARRASIKALIITHIGGLGFLIALFLLFVYAGSFDFGALSRLSGGLAVAVFILFLVAGWAKAAQFPFHMWLPDAMEAPTPISAYLHAAAMVKAGVFLMARVLIASPALPTYLGLLVAGMAIVTLFMAIMNYFRQDDLKRLLAYSTIAHLGYMFIGLALGVWGSAIGFRGGLLHLLSHGAAKGTLFLAVGAIAYGTGTRRISELRGLASKMPLAATAFVMGAVAVTGIPPFATFWSKFMIFSGSLEAPGGAVLLVLMAVESVVCFAWLLYIAHKVFLGEPSPAAAQAARTPLWMGAVLVLGMALCLAAPLAGLPLVNLIRP